MGETIHSILNQSAMKILRPLVRVMLRNGISCGSFEELVRKAYVDEAYAMAHEEERKTTVSAISAQTGLSRKEVKRINELQVDDHAGLEQKYNRGIRVISGWLNDDEFTDAEGSARPLPVDGETGSFAALVRRCSGDMTTKAMLDLLQAAGCVELTGDRICLTRHAYVPGNDSAEVIRILGNDTNELLNTIDHNLTAEVGNRRFQRKVSTASLDAKSLDTFRKLTRQRSQSLLEQLDTWLSQHEADSEEDACYVSLGIYFYEH